MMFWIFIMAYLLNGRMAMSVSFVTFSLCLINQINISHYKRNLSLGLKCVLGVFCIFILGIILRSILDYLSIYKKIYFSIMKEGGFLWIKKILLLKNKKTDCKKKCSQTFLYSFPWCRSNFFRKSINQTIWRTLWFTLNR